MTWRYFIFCCSWRHRRCLATVTVYCHVQFAWRVWCVVFYGKLLVISNKIRELIHFLACQCDSLFDANMVCSVRCWWQRWHWSWPDINCLCVEVLSVSERDDIEAELTSTQKNQKLLSVLSRKSVEQFQHFLAALDKTDQQHITDRLRLGFKLPCGQSKHFHFSQFLALIHSFVLLINDGRKR